MKLTKEQEKGQEFLQTIINKAWEDKNFKLELIDNPVKAIENGIGQKINLEGNVEIIVEDQSNPSLIYLNIPKQPDYENLELTDEQLEVVAGGEVIGTAAVLATLLMAGIMVGQALR